MRGAATGLPSPLRELMALSRMNPRERDGKPSFWERPSRALPDRDGCFLLGIQPSALPVNHLGLGLHLLHRRKDKPHLAQSNAPGCAPRSGLAPRWWRTAAAPPQSPAAWETGSEQAGKTPATERARNLHELVHIAYGHLVKRGLPLRIQDGRGAGRAAHGREAGNGRIGGDPGRERKPHVQ